MTQPEKSDAGAALLRFQIKVMDALLAEVPVSTPREEKINLIVALLQLLRQAAAAMGVMDVYEDVREECLQLMGITAHDPEAIAMIRERT